MAFDRSPVRSSEVGVPYALTPDLSHPTTNRDTAILQESSDLLRQRYTPMIQQYLPIIIISGPFVETVEDVHEGFSASQPLISRPA